MWSEKLDGLFCYELYSNQKQVCDLCYCCCFGYLKFTKVRRNSDMIPSTVLLSRKSFFLFNDRPKLGVRLIHRCGLYTGKYGNVRLMPHTHNKKLCISLSSYLSVDRLVSLVDCPCSPACCLLFLRSVRFQLGIPIRRLCIQ